MHHGYSIIPWILTFLFVFAFVHKIRKDIWEMKNPSVVKLKAKPAPVINSILKYRDNHGKVHTEIVQRRV